MTSGLTSTLLKSLTCQTHDGLWNAAQTQLLREGRIHNYLRMLWGKKIIEWSRTPEKALAIMVELNNKYALDGRDPNSYSGIFWCLGRYDRPWAGAACFRHSSLFEFRKYCPEIQRPRLHSEIQVFVPVVGAGVMFGKRLLN